MRITVVGKGIIGLTTAITLRVAGHDVDIVHSSDSIRRVSEVAAAFWYPYCVEIDGYTERELSEPALRKFLEDSTLPETGITMESGYELFDALTSEKSKADPWWKSEQNLQFRRLGSAEIAKLANYRFSSFGEFRDGFELRLPVIHMHTYLAYLERQATELGIKITAKCLAKLADLAELDSNLFVNCSGLGAMTLVPDPSMIPKLGHVASGDFPSLGDAAARPKFLFIQHGAFAHEPLYIVPRGNHDVLVGGTVIEVDSSETDRAKMLEGRAKETQCNRIADRAMAFDSALASFDFKRTDCGYRPYRKPLRLELDFDVVPGKPVVHNYGHGGGGVTLSWGCANAVARIVSSLTEDISSTNLGIVHAPQPRDPAQIVREEWDKKVDSWIGSTFSRIVYNPDTLRTEKEQSELKTLISRDEASRVPAADLIKLMYQSAVDLIKHDDLLNWQKFHYVVLLQIGFLVAYLETCRKMADTALQLAGGPFTATKWILPVCCVFVAFVGLSFGVLFMLTMREGMRCLKAHRAKLDAIEQAIARNEGCNDRRFLFCGNIYNSREALRWGPIVIVVLWSIILICTVSWIAIRCIW